MTLVVAWRDNSDIHLAADSRLSFGQGAAPADVGAKITVIEMRVSGPTPAGTTGPTWTTARHLGLAVVGSLTTAAVLQATLTSVLGSLSAVGNVITMDDVSSIVEQLFQHVSQAVCAAIFNQGRGELVLVGWCDGQRMNRAFLFQIDANAFPIQVTRSEVLRSNKIEYRGSGSAAALAQHGNPLQVLKAVILDPNIPSVGGAVQYGRLRGCDFRLLMVRDYNPDDSSKTVEVAFFLHGLPLLGTATPALPAGYSVSGTAIDPFCSDINALLARGYLAR